MKLIFQEISLVPGLNFCFAIATKEQTFQMQDNAIPMRQSYEIRNERFQG